MREKPLILVADDNQDSRDILEARLTSLGYATAIAVDGEQALAQVRALEPDLILLDVMMPKIDGLEVCRQLRGDSALPFIPIILVTAKSAVQDVVAGLEAGADDYLTKPVDHAALVARLRSMLRIKTLQDRVQAQKAELAEWNETLQQKVAEQIAEIERMGRLRRFLSPQVADLIVSSGAEKQLESHRREITALFCDLRGFTEFSESADPEDVMTLLGAYHATIGKIIYKYEGTLERFVGDGVMVIFNDPVPLSNPALQAVKMAIEMREAMDRLIEKWRRMGHGLGFGIGISHGYATLGTIGFEGRFDYTAIGTVANVASRLCDEAKSGQILISARVLMAVEGAVSVEPTGELALKGIRRPVTVYNVLGSAMQTP